MKPKVDFGERLFHAPRAKPRVEKSADDAILTTLSGETIRWVKSHRLPDCKYKVPMSHFRERQLREMFRGLDFENRGAIDLSEFKNAVRYVQEHTKSRSRVFDNLQSIFEAMDEDGDGNVDFQEFSTAINGNSQSSISKLSEYDFERLHMKFVEYSTIKKRKFILDTFASKNLDPKYGLDVNSKNFDINSLKDKESDLPKYRYFKSLLGIDKAETLDQLSSATHTIEKKLSAKDAPLPRAFWMEQITKEYVEETLNSKETKTEADLRYEELFKESREKRLSYLESLKRDSESMQIEERIEEERRHIYLGKKAEMQWSRSSEKLEVLTPRATTTSVVTRSPNNSVKHSLEINRAVAKEAYTFMRSKAKSMDSLPTISTYAVDNR